MPANYGKHISNRSTPQSRSVPGRTDQIKNEAGGYVFQANDFTRLRRFLILGTEGGTYYANEEKLTIESADVVRRCLAENAQRTLNEIKIVVGENLAHKKDAAILALAIAASHTDDAIRAEALSGLSFVCKTPTHLFTFLTYCRELRGRGAGLRRALRNWYAQLPEKKLIQFLTKYQGRSGYTHRDVLRIARPKLRQTVEPEALVSELTRATALRWAVDGVKGFEGYAGGTHGKARPCRAPLTIEQLPRLIAAFEEAKKAEPKRLIQLIETEGLEREHLPTEALTNPDIWAALAPKMGLWGLIRNLGNMSKCGMLKPLSDAERTIIDRLSEKNVAESKLHPMLFLIAARTYGAGQGVRGKGTWSVCPKVVEALDEAFRTAFGNVVPTGKKIVVSVDFSGSMETPLSGVIGMSCREAASALALLTLATEPNSVGVGFTENGHIVVLPYGKRTSLREVQRFVEQHTRPQGTDCGLPIRWAASQGIKPDAVVLLTDNQTWAGPTHVFQDVRNLRQKTGARVAMANIAMAVNGSSLNAPEDKDAIDLVGFDASTPTVLAQFIGGVL